MELRQNCIESHMMGENNDWASSKSCEGARGGCAAYACVNLATATATIALQQGGKSLRNCIMESQLPLMMADVAIALMLAEAASASVTESVPNKPLPLRGVLAAA